MTKFICFSGKAGSGKDTAGKMLYWELLRYHKHLYNEAPKVLITHYADILKHICKSYFAWNGEKDEAGRELLQQIGTNHIREYDQDYFVDFIINLIKIFPNEWDYIIIPDARFPNEITRIFDAGFPVTHVRVNREEFETKLTSTQLTHSSETAMDEFEPDIYINNTTLYELQSQVQALAKLEIEKKGE